MPLTRFKPKSLCSHLPAYLSTTEACFGTLLAVFVMAVLPALFTARLANFRAKGANLFRERGIGLHRLYRVCAHIRAFTVGTDAFRHHLDVFFTQARVIARITRIHAFKTCINALLVHLRIHPIHLLEKPRHFFTPVKNA